MNTGGRQNSYFYDELNESAAHLTILVYRYTGTAGIQFLITVKENAIEADILSTKGKLSYTIKA